MKDLLSKYQNWFIIAAIFLSSIAISIRSNDGSVRLILGEYPILIFSLVVISSFLVVLYIQINQRRVKSLSNQIIEQSKTKSTEIDTLVRGLTARQREVYDLIVSGMTNKEIMAELYIEQSTLKSHINQIYKKINVKSRNELKSYIKDR